MLTTAMLSKPFSGLMSILVSHQKRIACLQAESVVARSWIDGTDAVNTHSPKLFGESWLEIESDSHGICRLVGGDVLAVSGEETVVGEGIQSGARSTSCRPSVTKNHTAVQ